MQNIFCYQLNSLMLRCSTLLCFAQDKDVRIILGNFDEEWALQLFCEAYREKMIGRKYQWILTGFSGTKLWQYYDAKGSLCSKQELLVAMDGYIITDITPVTRSQQRTISGMVRSSASDRDGSISCQLARILSRCNFSHFPNNPITN